MQQVGAPDDVRTDGSLIMIRILLLYQKNRHLIAGSMRRCPLQLFSGALLSHLLAAWHAVRISNLLPSAKLKKSGRPWRHIAECLCCVRTKGDRMNKFELRAEIIGAGAALISYDKFGELQGERACEAAVIEKVTDLMHREGINAVVEVLIWCTQIFVRDWGKVEWKLRHRQATSAN